MTAARTVTPQRLRESVQAILVANGCHEEVATVVAEGLVDADLHGVASHGVSRLGLYLDRLRSGAIVGHDAARIVQEWGTGAIIDAGHSFGAWSAARATDLCIAKAREAGMAIVVARGADHFGRAGAFSERMAAAGMVGIVAANTTPLMPAVGGAEAVIGNNPLSIAAPGNDGIPVTDMALSAVALGKIIEADRAGTEIPPTWATDAQGAPTTDPAAARQGLLLPAGGAKGFGLAFFIEVLTGILSGGAVGGEVRSLYQERDRPNECSHVFLAIDASRFDGTEKVADRVDRFAAQIRASERAPGVDAIFAPGDLERAAAARNAVELTLSTATVDELQALAAQAGVPSPLEAAA
ncbi:Ldh family oxidoreductase [Agrococcus sp. ProA11]|uniref:Ldh family oxidoreductase n=1 Tax=Agrococcus chionoecetis TaxID=3153752 RepID=UPI0032614945